MVEAGAIISYDEMSRLEGRRLQKGMNVQRGRAHSVFLMSRRPNAPYTDIIEDNGTVLIYEGHDIRPEPGRDPKLVDQPLSNSDGSLTDNGKFFEFARSAKSGGVIRQVFVYEKLQPSIWVFNGNFELVDAWQERREGRLVCKFKLHLVPSDADRSGAVLENPRLIPGEVKAAVWKRDAGRCVSCGAADNLHFDHVIPYSRGGTSLTAENIQLLCARHNLSKGARIG